MDKYLNKLKAEGLIEDFSITKNSNFEKVMLKVCYDEKHNEFKNEDNEAEKKYRKGYDLHKYRVEQSVEKISDEIKDIESLLMLYPQFVRSSFNLQKILEEAVEEYGMEYVRDNVEYVTSRKPKSYLSYTEKALKNNYAEEYTLNKQQKKREKERLKEEIIKSNIVEMKDEIKSQKETLSFEDFPNLSDESKNEVNVRAYNNFLAVENFSDSKTHRGIFEKCKKSFISQELHSMIEKGLISEVDLNIEKLRA